MQVHPSKSRKAHSQIGSPAAASPLSHQDSQDIMDAICAVPQLAPGDEVRVPANILPFPLSSQFARFEGPPRVCVIEDRPRWRLPGLILPLAAAAWALVWFGCRLVVSLF